MQMRKLLLIHISSIGCCNPLVTMLNNGNFWLSILVTPVFSTPAIWCRVLHSRVFSRPVELVMIRDALSTRYSKAYSSFYLSTSKR